MAENIRKRNLDMTSGPLFRKIVLFAIPLALSSILQLFFNAADQIVVGQFAGTESLAAVGSTVTIINLIVNIFIGLSIGSNVAIAKAIGERNDEKASRGMHTGILLGFISGIIVSVIGLIFARRILELMNYDPEVIDKATLYLRIYFLGSPAMLVYNFGASALRAKGDTRRPLVFLTISGVINVLLNLLFVISFNMDVAGVGYATIISQYVSAICVLICLFREKDFSRLSFKKMRIHKEEFLFILRIGLPAGLASSMFSISNVIMQSSLNKLGKIAMAGHTTATGLCGFIFAGMDAVAQASVTFVGQNYGAKKFDRIRRINILCAIAVGVVGLFLGGVFVLFSYFFSSLYTSDKEVIKCSITLMKIVMPFIFLCGIMNVFNSTLRGIGYSSVPTLISLVCVCGLRILWVYTIFPLKGTLTALYTVQPISWALASLTGFIIYLVLIKRREKQVMGKKQETEEKTA